MDWVYQPQKIVVPADANSTSTTFSEEEFANQDGDRAHVTSAKLDDVSWGAPDNTCSFKLIDFWNNRRNSQQKALQNFRKPPHIAVNAYNAQDLYQPQRTTVPPNTGLPSTVLSEEAEINQSEEHHRCSPSLQPMPVQPSNAPTLPNHRQTSASVPLMEIVKWDGVSQVQSIIQTLLDAFKAKDYLDCVGNLEAHGIEPSIYINNLDKVCAPPIRGSTLNCSRLLDR